MRPAKKRWLFCIFFVFSSLCSISFGDTKPSSIMKLQCGLSLRGDSIVILCFILFQASFIAADSHAQLDHDHHGPSHFHHRHLSNATVARNDSVGDVNSAKAMVRRAQKALHYANGELSKNVRYNNYRFKSSSALVATPKEPAVLDYNSTSINNNGTDDRRRLVRASGRNSTIDPSGYTVPPELVSAARIVAESEAQTSN